MNKVVNISVDQLMHHPKNPREEIGDITELAESIKQNGIMQNLTVYVAGMRPEIPVTPFAENPNGDHNEHRYYVLIGNRRLEAAKAAGLKEVPCVIAPYMSEADQVSMMMQENMQRENLTFVEEAFGFQMMLDLGENVNSIARKTGFSDTTVRNRTKIAQLDKELVKEKVSSFQLSLSDFAKLNEVDDIKERQKILEKAASSNDLKWKTERYLENKKKKADKEKVLAILEEKGIEHLEELDDYSPSGWTVLERKYPSELLENPGTIEGIDWDAVEGYGIFNGYTQLFILAKKGEYEKPEDPEQVRRMERQKKLDALKEYMDGETDDLIKDMEGFAKKILEGEIKTTDLELTANPLKTLWDMARDIDTYISFHSMDYGLAKFGYFDDIKAECGDDVDACDIAVSERMKGISIEKQLTAGILGKVTELGTSSIMDWRFRRSEYTMTKVATAFAILHKWGYEYRDEELKDMMQGKGTFWEQADELLR